jgi:predicted PurR-regulated permease PerM
VLGLVAGLLEFVPFFGPVVAGLVAVLVAFPMGPQMALYVALVMLAVQQLENHLLLPLVQRWAVELPPVLALGAVLVFGTLFGIPGVVFGTPLMVLAMVLVRMLYVEQTLEAGRSA